jgi:hypothetical protein
MIEILVFGMVLARAGRNFEKMLHPNRMLPHLRSLISLFLVLSVTPVVKAEFNNLASEALSVYESCGLNGKIRQEAFTAAYRNASRVSANNGRIAIVDFTLPSNQPRLFIVDLKAHELLYSGLVAHGSGSGDLMAVSFSNTPESHQSSTGLYRVGEKITSPKHGDALLLEGLERGVNDKAREREIIIHGADYVSNDFVRLYGRIGRSHGCPAVSRKDIGMVIQLLKDGGLLYIYAGRPS